MKRMVSAVRDTLDEGRNTFAHLALWLLRLPIVPDCTQGSFLINKKDEAGWRKLIAALDDLDREWSAKEAVCRRTCRTRLLVAVIANVANGSTVLLSGGGLYWYTLALSLFATATGIMATHGQYLPRQLEGPNVAGVDGQTRAMEIEFRRARWGMFSDSLLERLRDSKTCYWLAVASLCFSAVIGWTGAFQKWIT